jgi:probable rRNA maturation factor
MIEVEVFGAEGRLRDGRARPGRVDARVDALSDPSALPPLQEVARLCAAAAAAAGVHDGHLAVEFVDERRIAELNARYRAREGPTDVLSFPVDGAEPVQGARELGDVVICLARTSDVREAIVHGVLHLVGMDHESDDGEMLSLQHELLARERG